ncbi:MAG: peptidoglycan DD-metalloendopeptidase family protein [Desulfohalobiaceae bacterium]
MDYFTPNRSKLTLGRPRKRWRLLLPCLLCLLAFGVILALSGRNSGSHISTGNMPQPEVAPETVSLTASSPVAPAVAPAPPPEPVVVESKIKPGQTASDILDGLLSPAEIHALSVDCRDVYPLERLKAGNTYRLFTREEDGAFSRLEYEIDSDEKLCVLSTGQGMTVRRDPIHYDLETRLVRGSIASSLFESVAATGESDELAIRLAEIFAWDVDFVRDLRVGDDFRCLVEKRSRDGEFANYGRVLAAWFTNNGRTFQAYLFEDDNGRGQYFNEQGNSVRKAFLKAPLSFRRISSGYSKSRLHPILKVRRPHQAIDYAAPTGTPIKTVGDGVVSEMGYTKAAGRYVKIRHNSVYETVYNHMSRYASSTKKGARVTQGQVIGYVGATGYATGPHLDFRMKKNGQYVNPLTIESPSCEPVPAEAMDLYLKQIRPLQATLEGCPDTRRAEVETPAPSRTTLQ